MQPNMTASVDTDWLREVEPFQYRSDLEISGLILLRLNRSPSEHEALASSESGPVILLGASLHQDPRFSAGAEIFGAHPVVNQPIVPGWAETRGHRVVHRRAEASVCCSCRSC